MTQQTQISLPEGFPLEANKVVDLAKAIVVWDAEGYKAASDFASNCKTAINKIEERRKEVKSPYKQACDDIDAQAKAMKAPFEEAMRIAQTTAYEFQCEQNRKAEEARQQALREAAEERQRLEKQVEIEEAKVVSTMTHEERIAQEAKVIDLKNQAQTVGAVTPIVKTVKSSAGVVTKTKFKPEVIDIVAFVKWCAANIDSNPAVSNFLEVKQSKLNTFVTSMNGEIKMDGVSIVKETVISSRAKKGSSTTI